MLTTFQAMRLCQVISPAKHSPYYGVVLRPCDESSRGGICELEQIRGQWEVASITLDAPDRHGNRRKLIVLENLQDRNVKWVADPDRIETDLSSGRLQEIES